MCIHVLKFMQMRERMYADKALMLDRCTCGHLNIQRSIQHAFTICRLYINVAHCVCIAACCLRHVMF